MSRRKLIRSVAGVALLAAVGPLVIVGCGKKPDDRTASDTTWPDNHPGPKVVVSFAPLYCLATNVAGDDAVVRNVMTTTGPHEFNPTPEDAHLVAKADLFFIVGLGLDEKQAELMKQGAKNEKLKVIELAERDEMKGKLREGHDEPDHGADHKHEKDPHVWLSPDLAVLMVNAIRDELKAADPAHAAGYDARAAAYVAKLNELKGYGLEKLKGKQNNRLVTFHDSMAYFADTFKLDIRGVLTKKPNQEPDAQQMKELIRICADPMKPTRVIAVEPQYSTSTSGETLRKELVNKGVQDPVLVEFNTLETVKPDDLKPDWYEKEMRKNIDALAAALK
jgi:ABC-type Zn uptake system ZnuABC Zn-binding protein ZnuA